jgi:hypothetical protein
VIEVGMDHYRRPPKAAQSVLDGRERGGRLVCAGIDGGLAVLTRAAPSFIYVPHLILPSPLDL